MYLILQDYFTYKLALTGLLNVILRSLLNTGLDYAVPSETNNRTEINTHYFQTMNSLKKACKFAERLPGCSCEGCGLQRHPKALSLQSDF